MRSNLYFIALQLDSTEYSVLSNATESRNFNQIKTIKKWQIILVRFRCVSS